MGEPGGWCRYDAKTGCCLLDVQVQPNARSSAIVGVHGGALKIRVAAPALDNRANAALVAFLRDRLDLRRSQIAIRHGAHDRRKQVKIAAGPDYLPELSRRLARGGALSPDK